MNKQLATYLFSNEILFKNPDSIADKLVEVVEPDVKKRYIEKTVEKPLEQPKLEVVEVILKPSKVDSLISNFMPTVVIVNSLTANQKEFLTKILGSIKKSMETITLIDLEGYDKQIFKSEINSGKTVIQKVILYGVAMSNFEINILLFPYQKLNHKNIDFLIVDDLSTIEVNLKDEKRLLWGALKSMF